MSLLEQAAGALGQAAGQVPLETAHSALEQLNLSIQTVAAVGGPTGDRLVAEAQTVAADLEAVTSRMSALRTNLQDTAQRILQGYA
jgi:hypothetical protein